jgi:hypothetical protein
MSDCLICDSQTAQIAQTNRDATRVRCDICGIYEMTRSLAATLRHNSDKRRRMALAAHTRQANRLGDTVVLSTQNYEALAAQHLHTPIARKLRLLLEALAEQSEYPGDKVSIDTHTTFPLIDAFTPAEVGYLLRALHARGDTEPANNDRWIVSTARMGTARTDRCSGGARHVLCCHVVQGRAEPRF